MTGAVLAGGQSRRMGTPKEGILLPDGRSMLQHVLDALRAACGRIAVVGVCAGAEIPADATHIPDRRPGEGPMAGLEALLASGLDEGYLVAGCDQPLLTPALLRRLSEGSGQNPCFFRAEDGTGLDPFPGVFPVALLPGVRAALDAGERSVRRFLRGRSVDWVTLSEGDRPLLRSLNTPEDVSEAAVHWPGADETAQNA